MTSDRTDRLSIRISPRLHALVTAAGSRAGMSQAQIIEAALEGFFAGGRDDDRDAGIIRRLDQLGRQVGRLERNDLIHGETLTLFLKFMFAVILKVTPEEHAAAMRLADKRFADFVDGMTRQLASGKRVLQDALEEVVPEPGDFASLADIDLGEPIRRRRANGARASGNGASGEKRSGV